MNTILLALGIVITGFLVTRLIYYSKMDELFCAIPLIVMVLAVVRVFYVRWWRPARLMSSDTFDEKMNIAGLRLASRFRARELKARMQQAGWRG